MGLKRRSTKFRTFWERQWSAATSRLSDVAVPKLGRANNDESQGVEKERVVEVEYLSCTSLLRSSTTCQCQCQRQCQRQR